MHELSVGSVTAPDWSADPAQWCCWYLDENADLYREFRRLADEMLRRRPGTKLSADQVCHVVRWNSRLAASGDYFAVNNNATALFARLYVEERPQHEGVFSTRKSVLDYLPPEQWDRVLLAFESVRDDHPQRYL